MSDPQGAGVPARPERRLRLAFPPGAMAVGMGLVVYGGSTYGVLAVAARQLDARHYAGFSAFWALLNIAGIGLFLPLDQEVSRGVADRRARREGRGALVRRAWGLGIGMGVAAGAVAIALGSPMAHNLFGGQWGLVWVLAVAMVGAAALYLTWGTLGGNGRFPAYGWCMATLGFVLIAAGVVLAVAKVRSPVPYAAAFPLAYAVASITGMASRGDLGGHGEHARWSELTASMGQLTAASVMSQLVVNSGTVVVAVLATPAEAVVVGQFLSGLVLTRVPIFLYTAVNVTLLPELSALLAVGDRAGFARRLRALSAQLAAAGAVIIVGSAVLGPWVLQLVFGETYRLSGASMAVLAGGAVAYMLTLAFGQGVVAYRRQAWVAWAWAFGVVCLGIATAVGSSLLGRVQAGYLAGSIGSLVAMGLAVWWAWSRVPLPEGAASGGSSEPGRTLGGAPADSVVESDPI